MALGLVLIAGIAAAALPSDPVALLVKLQGDVQVQRVGQEGALPGQVGLQLNAGDEVVVAEGAEAVVLYRTGRLVKAASSVTIEEVTEEGSSTLFANTVRTLGQVATTDAQRQPNRQGMIRPMAGAPVPILPRNGIKVLSVRPSFTWFDVPEASEYVLQLQREGPDSSPPVRYPVGSDTTWTLPLSESPLIPGATYVWTVGGQGVGRVAEQQRFTVASGEDIVELQATLNGLIAAGIDPAGDGLFLAALAYRDAGFYYEAQRSIERIEEEGEGTGRAFFMLRGDVYDAVGDSARANESFQRADEAPEG